jgi:hypothetical protein
MKIEELASLMGITKEELEKKLKSDDVIELKLTEKKEMKKPRGREMELMI